MATVAAAATAAAAVAAPAAAATGAACDARIPVWIDCDPGHDDALALVLAGHSDRLRVVGVSTVAGNQTVAKTTNNALKIMAVSGLQDIDVVAGADRPLVRPPMICPEVHGETGLDCSGGFPSLELRAPLVGPAVAAMDRGIRGAGGRVTVVTLACLTNVALLLRVYPDVAAHIERIVMLGGAIGIGNMTPAAEFNILVDPEAAHIVFESGLPLVQIPLEVSHTALVTADVLAAIEAQLHGSRYGRLIGDLLMFFQQSYRQLFQFPDPPLHDPLAVAYVIQPDLFVTTETRVDIEISSPLTAGRTVCDIYNMSTKPKNVTLARSVDVAAFWKLFMTSLVKADASSCLNAAAAAATAGKE